VSRAHAQEEAAAATPTPTTPVAPVGLGRVWPMLPAMVKRVVSGLLRTGDMTPGGQWLLRAARAGCPTAKFNLARALQVSFRVFVFHVCKTAKRWRS